MEKAREAREDLKQAAKEGHAVSLELKAQGSKVEADEGERICASIDAMSGHVTAAMDVEANEDQINATRRLILRLRTSDDQRKDQADSLSRLLET